MTSAAKPNRWSLSGTPPTRSFSSFDRNPDEILRGPSASRAGCRIAEHNRVRLRISVLLGIFRIPFRSAVGDFVNSQSAKLGLNFWYKSTGISVSPKIPNLTENLSGFERNHREGVQESNQKINARGLESVALCHYPALYVTRRLTVGAVARKDRCSRYLVLKSLRSHGIPRHAGGLRKHPELETLKLGESIVVDRPRPRKFHPYYYFMAQGLGVRLSVKTLDAKTSSLLAWDNFDRAVPLI